MKNNNKTYEKGKFIWESIKWIAKNSDMMPKIMGREATTERERNNIKNFLLAENRFEFYFAMAYAEKYEMDQKAERPGKPVDEIANYGDEEFQKLAFGQLCSFAKWCDVKDFDNIMTCGSPIDIYRLCYIALSVGYDKLALTFIYEMGEHGIIKGGNELDHYGDKLKLLLKKWVRDFYYKQPEGKRRNKLAKRIVLYSPLLTKTTKII